MNFLEGEVYFNKNTNRHIMILGLGEETEEELVFAILEVDPNTMATLFPSEIVIDKSKVDEWEHVELV